MALPTPASNTLGKGCITRQHIVNFPFPHKLWLAASLECADFLRWNQDGTVILLDLAELGEYLNSPRSIFKIKNRSVFLEHLDEFGFQRLKAAPEADDMRLHYKNENFQRDRKDLLAKVRRTKYELDDMGNSSGPQVKKAAENKTKQSASLSAVPALAKETAINPQAAERMKGDLCFMFHGGMSDIQKSRLHFQTVLHFQNESRLLKETLRISDENAARARRTKMEQGSGRSSKLTTDDDQIIEIPADLFENPQDSVMNLGAGNNPEYAGYYGNCSKETVKNFFGDYLPIYEDGTIKVRTVGGENTSSNVSGLVSESAAATPTPVFSIDIHPAALTPNLCPTPPIKEIFSAELEPTFKHDDDVEQVNNSNEIESKDLNNFKVVEDISMEDFIKFKDPLDLSIPPEGELSTINAVKRLRDSAAIVEEIFQGCSVVDRNNTASNAENFRGELSTINAVQRQRDRSAIVEEIFQGCSGVDRNNTASNAENFPQMPKAVKMELAEDPAVVEADFRKSFSQYKAALNLLFKRHSK